MKLTGNQLRFAKVRPTAIIPSKRDEDAGYDVYPCFDEEYKRIDPHSTSLVPTGIASALSNEYYLQVHERGSTGSKGIKYGAGVIDPGYRGEIFVAITNTTNYPLIISKGDVPSGIESRYGGVIIYPYEKAIAQLVVHRLHKMDVAEVSYDELKAITSERGDGALGSSNK